MRKKKTVSFR